MMNDDSHHGKSLSESGQLKHHSLEILEAMIATISAGINSKSSTVPLGCFTPDSCGFVARRDPFQGPQAELFSNTQK